MRWRWAVLRSSTLGMVAPCVVSSFGEDAIRIEEADQPVRETAPMSCMTMNIGADDGSMPAKRVGQRAGDRDGRVGEAGRGGEPVGAADPDADGERHDVGRARCERSRGSPAADRRGDDLGQPQRAPTIGSWSTARRRAARTSGWRRTRRGNRRGSGRRCSRPASRVEIVPNSAVDERDDRVEVGAGDRAEA